MSQEIKLKLIADFAPIEPQQLRRWQEEIGGIFKALNVPLGIEFDKLQGIVRDVKSIPSARTGGSFGPIVDPKTGQPFGGGGGAGATGLTLDASLDKFHKVIKTLTLDFERMSRVMGGAGGAGGAGTPTGPTKTGGALGVGQIGAIVAAVAKVASFAFELPMEQLRSRAAMGGTLGRDVRAMGRTDYESLMRLDPEMRGSAQRRGVTSGYAKSMGTNAMWGTGIALGAAALGVPTGGLSLLALGGLGAAGGIGYGFLSGKHQKAGIAGYEEALERMGEERGVHRELFRSARGFAVGPGTGIQTAGWMGAGSGGRALGIGYGGRKYGLGPEVMGPAYRESLGILGSESEGMMDRFGRAARLGGLSPTGAVQAVGKMQQFGGTAGGDMDRLENMMAKAVERGVDNASIMKRYLDFISGVAGKSGGIGGGGVGFASDMAMAAMSRFPKRGGLAMRTAQSSMGIIDEATGARSGRQAFANILAASGSGDMTTDFILAGMADTELRGVITSGALAAAGIDMTLADADTLQRKKIAYGIETSAYGRMPGGAGLADNLRNDRPLTPQQNKLLTLYTMYGGPTARSGAESLQRGLTHNARVNNAAIAKVTTADKEYRNFMRGMFPTPADSSGMYDEPSALTFEGAGERLAGGVGVKARFNELTGEAAKAGGGMEAFEDIIGQQATQMEGVDSLINKISVMNMTANSAAGEMAKVTAELQKWATTILGKTPGEVAAAAKASETIQSEDFKRKLETRIR